MYLNSPANYTVDVLNSSQIIRASRQATERQTPWWDQDSKTRAMFDLNARILDKYANDRRWPPDAFEPTESQLPAWARSRPAAKETLQTQPAEIPWWEKDPKSKAISNINARILDNFGKDRRWPPEAFDPESQLPAWARARPEVKKEPWEKYFPNYRSSQTPSFPWNAG
ncbi:hypothetical protein Ddc_04445 [Ditylenchus destructor]|nr:hypothetical protein Ddc_04445 [Ditylenchus destructor]